VKIFTSKLLTDTWGLGHCTVGAVTFESAAYVARYITKKITGSMAEDHYKHVTRYGELVDLKPEYISMSRRPGIGSAWLTKYKTDVYPSDHVIINNRKIKPPKFYDKMYKNHHPQSFHDIQIEREYDAFTRSEDNTPARLQVKETLKQIKHKQIKRSFECY